MQTVVNVVLAVVIVYVLLLAAVWRFQERVVFQPPSASEPFSTTVARQVRYRSADGVDLFAYIIGECAPDRAVVLAFHGNADLSRWFVPWAADVVRTTNSCVMLPEYRGYDGIGGVPTYAGSALDARAALDYARRELHATPARTVYFGHSLGSAIAAELAAVDLPRSLVLQSPLSSAREMATRLPIPGLSAVWSVISRVHYNTLERVAALDVPVWVAHGDRDIVVPVEMGRAVFAAARRKGELLIVERAGHNDVGEVGGSAYRAWLTHAIEATDPTPAAPAEKRLVL